MSFHTSIEAGRTSVPLSKELLFSAIQKYIRRGLYHKAVWCVNEVSLFTNLLDPANMAAYLRKYPDRNEKDTRTQLKGLRTNLLNRFKVISVEDVGMGQPGICSLIDVLIKQLLASDWRDTAPLMKIVYHLCQARKLRLISDMKSVYHLPPYYGENESEEKLIHGFIKKLRTFYDIPNETGDETMETQGFGIFYWVSRNITKITDKHPIWAILLKRRPEYANELACLRRWYTEKMREHVLFFYQAVLLTCFPFVAKAPSAESDIEMNTSSAFIAQLKCVRLRVIDDYVIDKHVKGSGETSVALFAVEGAVVVNEASELLQPGYRSLYIHLKKAIDTKKRLTDSELFAAADAQVFAKRKFSLEEEHIASKRQHLISSSSSSSSESVMDPNDVKESSYSYVVRAQVTTSKSKADAYFAKDPLTSEFLFIKGPLKSVTEAQNAIEMNQWKIENGLPALASLRVILMVPDRWPEGTPMGLRNTLSRTEKAPFLVSESTVSEEIIRSHITTYGDFKRAKGAKLTGTETWPANTDLVDWTVISSHIVVSELSQLEMTDYVKLLLFRWIFGISDLADRNFLKRDNGVYSIDEEYRNRPVSFMTELKQAKCLHIREWLRNNYSHINSAIQVWSVPEFYKEKLAYIKDQVRCEGLFA